MSLKTFIAGLLTLLCLPAFAADGGEGFPGRHLYPAVDVIELEQLHERYGEVTIVDVRSRYEYDTLRIKGAAHIPLSADDFAAQVEALRQESGKPIVFYCNGRTCRKSYKAATKAAHGGVEGTVAFDAGILEWTRAYPDLAELLGKSPVDPNRLISKESFESHLLTPDEFSARIGGDTLVVDARDRSQRHADRLFVGRETRVPFDDRAGWDRLVDQARAGGKTLLIYDAVGKQVRWLQYYLESRGAQYYFMRNGVKGFYDNLMGGFTRKASE